nr:CDP-alcohol phosphatidyltransferase family protein [Mycolicibacterium boenickei]
MIKGRMKPPPFSVRMLPSAMTVAAICLGLSSVKMALDGRPTESMAFLAVAAILDALDGRVARMLNATSKMGEEIDSLADAVNFGVAPAFIVYGTLLSHSLLGQYAAPSAPGGPPPTEAPNLRAFNNGYFFPQNEKPSAPGQGTVVGVEPGQENADISGLDWMRQMHTLYRNGNLRGSLLGQVPKEQLGEPLPGTAPPPGANIPSGLGENLPDPAAPPPAPGAPPAPPVPAPPAP